MQFHVSSYRHGFELLKTAGSAADELLSAVTTLSTVEIERLRVERQTQVRANAAASGGRASRTGVQGSLNAELNRLLTSDNWAWQPQVPLFKADVGTGKGYWTMDFRKEFDTGEGVGVEVTFNHAEALPWTLIRPTLAYQSDDVLEGSRIEVGVIIIGTDHLKGSRTTPGGLRVDSAVGTYERLLALLPRMKWVVQVPLTIIGLDWADGEMVGSPTPVSLHGPIKPDPFMVRLDDLSTDETTGR
jgi:restriction endonuclease BglII